MSKLITIINSDIFIASNTQSAGQQLVQLLGSSLERWNQLGDQITTSIGMRMEQMENQIHDLAKEIRQTIYNHNLRQNATLTKIGYRWRRVGMTDQGTNRSIVELTRSSF